MQCPDLHDLRSVINDRDGGQGSQMVITPPIIGMMPVGAAIATVPWPVCSGRAAQQLAKAAVQLFKLNMTPLFCRTI